MTEQHASVIINAPVQQVYELFTHFNDFPKFMSFVKEVTYYDEQRSHWVAQVAGQHEWDAVNEDWIPGQQVGWRSTRGLGNTGRVKFQTAGSGRTMVDVYLSYTPPGGVVGNTADMLGVGSQFARILQSDLNNFARMVEQAPPGALDPMQSHYLFHEDSAITRGQATEGQRAAMANDPMMQSESLRERQERIEQEVSQEREMQQQHMAEQERQVGRAQQAAQEQQAALQEQARVDRQERQERQEQEAAARPQHPLPLDPVRDTLGGRNAAMERTASGERDARNRRFPHEEEDPMLSRAIRNEQGADRSTAVENLAEESPWRNTIRGRELESAEGEEEKPQADGQ